MHISTEVLCATGVTYNSEVVSLCGFSLSYLVVSYREAKNKQYQPKQNSPLAMHLHGHFIPLVCL